MTCTVLLEVVTADGTAAWGNSVEGRSFQATPPSSFDDLQAGTIPIRINHRPEFNVGFVDYLETGLGHGNGGLYAVGVADVDAEMVGDMFCSPILRSNAGYDVDRWGTSGLATASYTALVECSLVDATAGVAAAPVRAWAGDYREPGARARWDRPGVPAILDRAVAASGYELRWRRPDRLRIHRDTVEDRPVEWRDGRPPRSEICIHGGGFVLGVR